MIFTPVEQGLLAFFAMTIMSDPRITQSDDITNKVLHWAFRVTLVIGLSALLIQASLGAISP
jgi:hypothetical protein